MLLENLSYVEVEGYLAEKDTVLEEATRATIKEVRKILKMPLV